MEYCGSCDLLFINGLKCHEFDCPDKWRDFQRECEYCGERFKPEEPTQAMCSQECADNYY